MNIALVTVGDELLAGETVNTNAAWLCEQLTASGCRVERVTTVPDRVADIARVVNEYQAEYEAVIVTGGLGPTPDDITMEAIGAAVGRPLEHHEEAKAWLTEQGGYSAADLDAGTTDLPAGARMVPNEVGVAPGAVIESIYVLPGVPTEMKHMFEAIAPDFNGETRYTEVIVADEPESELLARLTAVADQFDVDVGSYPGEFVRVKISGTDKQAVRTAASWFRARTTLAERD